MNAASSLPVTSAAVVAGPAVALGPHPHPSVNSQQQDHVGGGGGGSSAAGYYPAAKAGVEEMDNLRRHHHGDQQHRRQYGDAHLDAVYYNCDGAGDGVGLGVLPCSSNQYSQSPLHFDPVAQGMQVLSSLGPPLNQTQQRRRHNGGGPHQREGVIGRGGPPSVSVPPPVVDAQPPQPTRFSPPPLPPPPPGVSALAATGLSGLFPLAPIGVVAMQPSTCSSAAMQPSGAPSSQPTPVAAVAPTAANANANTRNTNASQSGGDTRSSLTRSTTRLTGRRGGGGAAGGGGGANVFSLISTEEEGAAAGDLPTLVELGVPCRGDKHDGGLPAVASRDFVVDQSNASSTTLTSSPAATTTTGSSGASPSTVKASAPTPAGGGQHGSHHHYHHRHQQQQQRRSPPIVCAPLSLPSSSAGEVAGGDRGGLLLAVVGQPAADLMAPPHGSSIKGRMTTVLEAAPPHQDTQRHHVVDPSPSNTVEAVMRGTIGTAVVRAPGAVGGGGGGAVGGGGGGGAVGIGIGIGAFGDVEMDDMGAGAVGPISADALPPPPPPPSHVGGLPPFPAAIGVGGGLLSSGFRSSAASLSNSNARSSRRPGDGAATMAVGGERRLLADIAALSVGGGAGGGGSGVYADDPWALEVEDGGAAGHVAPSSSATAVLPPTGAPSVHDGLVADASSGIGIGARRWRWCASCANAVLRPWRRVVAKLSARTISGASAAVPFIATVLVIIVYTVAFAIYTEVITNPLLAAEVRVGAMAAYVANGIADQLLKGPEEAVRWFAKSLSQEAARSVVVDLRDAADVSLPPSRGDPSALYVAFPVPSGDGFLRARSTGDLYLRNYRGTLRALMNTMVRGRTVDTTNNWAITVGLPSGEAMHAVASSITTFPQPSQGALGDDAGALAAAASAVALASNYTVAAVDVYAVMESEGNASLSADAYATIGAFGRPSATVPYVGAARQPWYTDLQPSSAASASSTTATTGPLYRGFIPTRTLTAAIVFSAPLVNGGFGGIRVAVPMSIPSALAVGSFAPIGGIAFILSDDRVVSAADGTLAMGVGALGPDCPAAPVSYVVRYVGDDVMSAPFSPSPSSADPLGGGDDDSNRTVWPPTLVYAPDASTTTAAAGTPTPTPLAPTIGLSAAEAEAFLDYGLPSQPAEHGLLTVAERAQGCALIPAASVEGAGGRRVAVACPHTVTTFGNTVLSAAYAEPSFVAYTGTVADVIRTGKSVAITADATTAYQWRTAVVKGDGSGGFPSTRSQVNGPTVPSALSGERQRYIVGVLAAMSGRRMGSAGLMVYVAVPVSTLQPWWAVAQRGIVYIIAGFVAVLIAAVASNRIRQLHAPLAVFLGDMHVSVRLARLSADEEDLAFDLESFVDDLVEQQQRGSGWLGGGWGRARRGNKNSARRPLSDRAAVKALELRRRERKELRRRLEERDVSLWEDMARLQHLFWGVMDEMRALRVYAPAHMVTANGAAGMAMNGTASVASRDRESSSSLTPMGGGAMARGSASIPAALGASHDSPPSQQSPAFDNIHALQGAYSPSNAGGGGGPDVPTTAAASLDAPGTAALMIDGPPPAPLPLEGPLPPPMKLSLEALGKAAPASMNGSDYNGGGYLDSVHTRFTLHGFSRAGDGSVGDVLEDGASTVAGGRGAGGAAALSGGGGGLNAANSGGGVGEVGHGYDSDYTARDVPHDEIPEGDLVGPGDPQRNKVKPPRHSVTFGDSCLVDRDITVAHINIIQFHYYARRTHGPKISADYAEFITFVHAEAKRHGGVLESFSGDKLWVSFNASTRCDHHAVAACYFAFHVTTVVNSAAIGRMEMKRSGGTVVDPPPASSSSPRGHQHQWDYGDPFAICLYGINCGVATGRAFVGPLGNHAIRRHNIISNAITEAVALERQSLQYAGCSVLVGGDMIPAIEGYCQYLLLDASLLPGSFGKRRRIACLKGPMLGAAADFRVVRRWLVRKDEAFMAGLGNGNGTALPFASPSQEGEGMAVPPSSPSTINPHLSPYVYVENGIAHHVPVKCRYRHINGSFNALLEGQVGVADTLLQEAVQRLGTAPDAATEESWEEYVERSATIGFMAGLIHTFLSNGIDGRTYRSALGESYLPFMRLLVMPESPGGPVAPLSRQ